MSLYIFDPNALQVLGQIEGADWLKLQSNRPANGYSFQAYLDTWERLKAEGYTPFPGNISPYLFDIVSDGAIYGESGYARYIVRGDGEIVLLRWSTRPEKIALAESLGVTVTKVP